MGGDPEAWLRFEVDAEVLFWATYETTHRSGDGPSTPCELLSVARAPHTAGVGRVFPVGTTITEEHARELVLLYKRERGPFP